MLGFLLFSRGLPTHERTWRREAGGGWEGTREEGGGGGEGEAEAWREEAERARRARGGTPCRGGTGGRGDPDGRPVGGGAVRPGPSFAEVWFCKDAEEGGHRGRGLRQERLQGGKVAFWRCGRGDTLRVGRVVLGAS